MTAVAFEACRHFRPSTSRQPSGSDHVTRSRRLFSPRNLASQASADFASLCVFSYGTDSGNWQSFRQFGDFPLQAGRPQ